MLRELKDSSQQQNYTLLVHLYKNKVELVVISWNRFYPLKVGEDGFFNPASQGLFFVCIQMTHKVIKYKYAIEIWDIINIIIIFQQDLD